VKRELMGTSEKSTLNLNRRQFLALGGAGAAGVAVSGCTSHKLADFLELSESARRAPGGEEKWVASICGQCEGGCSIRVRTVGGRAVNITGNPFYPLNRNGLCPTGLAGLQALYSPDRVRGPLKRVGNRGEGKWEPISWEEAIHAVAQRLREIRQRSEPHTLVFLSGDCSGLMDTLVSRFCQAYGTPNDVRQTCAASETQALARYCTQGTRAPLTYDLDNTNCILSFGAPLLEASISPVRMMRAYGHLRQERPGPKAKIIQIESRFSATAAKADEWVPIQPGTEGALALGIAYVLIREGLYDTHFVEQHTFGFEDWTDAGGTVHQGFRTLVLREHNLDEVSRITTVPVSTILRIAKEFATHKPAIAMGEMTSTNAVYSLMAVHALNALVGSIDVSGGVVYPREAPLKELPTVQRDDVALRGLAQPRLDRASSNAFPLARHVATAMAGPIAEAKPYAANALFLYQANPLFSSPQPTGFARAFEKTPFIVSFSPFLDESSMQADFILPDHTYLERWQDVPAPAVVPYPLIGLRQPAVAPLYNTMHTGDALIQIAKQVGEGVADAFPWEDFLAALQYRVTGLFEAKRGGVVEPFTDKSWTALLEDRGWWSSSYHSFEEFWTQLQDKGGWWDPVYSFGEWARIFPTPSGKFEFYSLTLKQRLTSLADTGKPDVDGALRSLKLTARGDALCLPHFEAPRYAGTDDRYPFHLNIMRLLPLANGHNADQPFLQEILGPQVGMRWDSWLEINPGEARRLGVEDGDDVWVESPVGKLKLQARLNPGTMPEVVNMPANLGHTASGRWAAGIGVNPLQIAVQEYDYLAGLSAPGATRVKVYKA
jgi:anaerobic selenocysteine-containing dehydrogenase